MNRIPNIKPCSKSCQMKINSSQIIYSEHGYDECFEYKDGSGRVPDGKAVGYEVDTSNGYNDNLCVKLILFNDVVYSKYNHQYWDNIELEKDEDRIV